MADFSSLILNCGTIHFGEAVEAFVKTQPKNIREDMSIKAKTENDS